MQGSFEQRYNQLTGGGASSTPTPFVQSTSQGNDFQGKFNKLLYPDQAVQEVKPNLFQTAKNIVSGIKLPSILQEKYRTDESGGGRVSPVRDILGSGIFGPALQLLAKPSLIEDAFKLPDKSIRATQNFLAKEENVKITKPLADLQKVFENIFESSYVLRGSQRGISQTYLGMSEEVSKVFTKKIDVPETDFQKAQYTAGQIAGTVLAFIGGGAVIKGLNLAKATLPVLFATIGQTSSSAETTVTQRMAKLPVDAFAGYLFNFVPLTTKIFSPQMLKGAGLSAGIMSGQTFIDSLIEGLSPKDALIAARNMAIIGGVFHVAGTATGLFMDNAFRSRFKQGKLELTPQELRDKVINTDLENTEAGRGLLKLSFEAETQGKNVELSVLAAKKSFLADALKLKTPEGVEFNAGLVEPKGEITAKVAPEEGKVEKITPATEIKIPVTEKTQISAPTPPPSPIEGVSSVEAQKITSLPKELESLAQEALLKFGGKPKDLYDVSFLTPSGELVGKGGVFKHAKFYDELGKSFNEILGEGNLRVVYDDVKGDVPHLYLTASQQLTPQQLKTISQQFKNTPIVADLLDSKGNIIKSLELNEAIKSSQLTDFYTQAIKEVISQSDPLVADLEKIPAKVLTGEDITDIAEIETKSKVEFDLPKKQKELVVKEKQLIKKEEKQATELLDTIRGAISSGDMEAARVLHEDAKIGNPDLPSFDSLTKEIESYQEQTLSEVTKELKGEVTSENIDDPTNKILVIADQLGKHFKGPGSLYKIVGRERQYKTPEGVLTVGGDAKKAFDDLIFSTDIVGFSKNVRLLASKFDKIFSEISESIKAGDIDGASYESFKKAFKEQIDKRAIFRTKRGTFVPTGPTKGKAEIAEGGIITSGAPIAPSGTASGKIGKIGEFENIPVEQTEASNFKLFEKVRGLTDKYIEMIGKGTLGERYTSRRALGSFYPDTYNVRVNGMNDLGVAAHEDSHLLDAAYNISDALLEVKGWAKNGNPIYSPKTRGIRKEITNLYEEYYPGGKRTHKLKKRAVEGFAVLMEKYTEIPTTITEKYPNLVKQFLQEGGSYYKPVTGEMLKDLRAIVSEYQGLDPLDKIGARVTKNAIDPKKKFLNLFEKVRVFVEDEIYPVEKVAKLAGVHFTKNDPSLWLRAMQTGGGVYVNNILTKRGYWAFKGGDFVKTHDFNWKTLVDQLNKEKTHDSFGYYLVARREHFAYEELAEYKAKYDKTQEVVKSLGKEAGEVTGEGGLTPVQEAQNAKLEYERLKKILDNDGFTQEEVSEAYLANKDRFTKEEETFDVLVREDLNLLHDPEVQLVNNETYDKLTDKQGYATFKRRFEDELVGEEGFGVVSVKGGVKASFLRSRSGSARAIIDPVASSMRNHIEAVKKAMRQIVYNKIGQIAKDAAVPDMFQVLQLQVTADANNRIYYPQEKDPNIVMARIDYKRVPVLTDSLIKATIDNTLTFQSMNIFEQLLVTSSRMFTVGTTGMYPAFAITNFAADQWNAIVNSRNKYTPLVDSLKILKDAIVGQKGEAGRIYQMYEVLGGSRLTLSNFLMLPADEAVKAVINERNGIQKALDLANKGISIFSIPSNTSETVTRFAEFYKAIKAGKPQIVALEEAARITGPFHHIGSWRVKGATARNMIRAMPFANASLQILTQLIRTGADSTEGRKRIGFAMLALVGLYLGSIASVSLFGSDDQKEQYKDLRSTDLGLFMYLPFTNGKGLVRVKVSPELSVIATLMAMKVNEQLYGVKYKTSEYADAVFNILPNQMQFNDPAAMFLSWFSPIVKVPFELIANIKDYPNVRPIEGLGMQYKAPGERFNESTSTLAKVVGKKLNISPLKIDFLITGIFGRYTGFLTGKPGIYSIQSAYLRDYYFTMGRRVENFYDGYTKIQDQYKQIENFPANERSAILKKYGQYTRVNDLLKIYRDIDLKKDPLKAQQFRTKIIDEINKLSGESQKTSSLLNNPIAFIEQALVKANPFNPSEVSASEAPPFPYGLGKGPGKKTRIYYPKGGYTDVDEKDLPKYLAMVQKNFGELSGGEKYPDYAPNWLGDAKSQEKLSVAVSTKHDGVVKTVFGDKADDAMRVLKRKQSDGKIVGENTINRVGIEGDYTNTNGTVDRGLFRINSGTFNDFKRRKNNLLERNGIYNWDDMLDPEKNTKMAKLIFDEGGWDRWVASPADLLSEKEKRRRKKLGIQIME